MTDNSVLNRNLLAIASKDAELAARLTRADFSENVEIIESRTGIKIPGIKHQSRTQPLHSSFDPEKEAERLSNNYVSDGYYIFLGIGSGIHILPFLKRENISSIIIIEKNMEMFKSIINNFDLRDILLDNRVKLLIDYTLEEINNFILEDYIPALTGNLQSISLRARLNIDEVYFSNVIDTIKKSLSNISDDFTVQTYFGKKWFTNTLFNLESAAKSTSTLGKIKKAIVTGAGPSLEKQIPELLELKKDSFLIATDTSLPSLLDYDIKPDCVISIDCQQISYNHFLKGIPENIPLVLDLASPPDLTKLSDNLVFFTSGHPFSLYVNSNWRKFPFIDTSGGNVGHAAVSLAEKLGAEQIYLFGTDFSYPEGKSYCRGSYVYPYFRIKENRINPLENLFVNFLFRNNNTEKILIDGKVIYTTKPMITYKERLETVSNILDTELIQVKGIGVPLNIKKANKKLNHIVPFFSAGKTEASWKSFLQEYRNKIKKLPNPDINVSKYFSKLKPEEKRLWTTLLPSVAALRRDSDKKNISEAEILIKAKKWTLSIIDRRLK